MRQPMCCTFILNMAVKSRVPPSSVYCLKSKVDFSPARGDVYVFEIAQLNSDSEDDVIAASGSNGCINIYTGELKLTNQVLASQGADDVISSILFSGQNLWSSSTDGTVKSWDFRQNCKKPSCKLQGYNREPINSISTNTTNNLLVGGTDKVGEDASIYIWDVRSGRDPIGQFTESHSDDITQFEPSMTTLLQAEKLTRWRLYFMTVLKVVFSPDSAHKLVSGSTDGLVCLFDLSTLEEDEAALSVKNSESSVATVGFFGPNSEHVYCLTHQESLHAWKVSEAEPISTQTNIKEMMAEKFGVGVDYLINCHYQQSSHQLFLVAGDHSGGIRILKLDDDFKEIRPVALLHGGHIATVRTVLWSTENCDRIVSGGEDGAVCLWQGTTA